MSPLPSTTLTRNELGELERLRVILHLELAEITARRAGAIRSPSWWSRWWPGAARRRSAELLVEIQSLVDEKKRLLSTS